MSLRTKIITQSIRLFNKKGYGAVNLAEIAKSLGITRGNLTYHFSKKDDLLKTIVGEMWQKIEAERAKSRQFPSFENLHNEVQLYYRFQKQYSFVFLDTHVLQHAVVKKQFREMTKQTIADNKATIAFSINMGNMKPEPFPGAYHNLAFVTWMLLFFWLAQQIIRGEKTNEDGEKMVWSNLLPHFTEKGVQSFKAFFGEGYYNSLGEAFEMDLSKAFF